MNKISQRFLTGLIAMAALSACTDRRQSAVIFVPARDELKYKSLRHAAELFGRQHDNTWRVEVLDPARHSFSAELKRSPRAHFFTPAASTETLALLEELKTGDALSGRYLMGQVIASEKAHTMARLHSTFFPSSRYASGLGAELAGRERGKEVLIFRPGEPSYFGEVAEGLRGELGSAGFRKVREFVYQAGSFQDAWKKARARPGSVLVFLRWPALAEPRLAKEAAFVDSTRVYIYGEPGARYLGKKGRELSVLFWHPGLLYRDSSAYSNCDFHRDFVAAFSYEPDFHAAFLYTSLQVLAAAGGSEPSRGAGYPTITGRVVLGENGLRENMRPFLKEVSADGERLLVPRAVQGPCAGAQLAPLVQQIP